MVTVGGIVRFGMGDVGSWMIVGAKMFEYLKDLSLSATVGKWLEKVISDIKMTFVSFSEKVSSNDEITESSESG